jgi:hypothetical protein
MYTKYFITTSRVVVGFAGVGDGASRQCERLLSNARVWIAASLVAQALLRTVVFAHESYAGVLA